MQSVDPVQKFLAEFRHCTEEPTEPPGVVGLCGCPQRQFRSREEGSTHHEPADLSHVLVGKLGFMEDEKCCRMRAEASRDCPSHMMCGGWKRPGTVNPGRGWAARSYARRNLHAMLAARASAPSVVSAGM